MLHIYTGKENLPKNVPFIFDADGASSIINLLFDDITSNILQQVEQAVPVTRDMFRDRFGGQLYTDCLSTSTKILLLIHQTNYIINADEIGKNAFSLLLKFTDGSVYFSDCWRDLDYITCPCTVNDTLCTTAEEVFDAL